jgi:peptidoglycan/LPS O-acetylase OafA/YrhL
MQESGTKYFPPLDGLRFFCCAMVVVNHGFMERVALGVEGSFLQNFVHNLGTTGVDIFFALSGFLITKILLEEKAARGSVDLFAFYMRRTLRIWPV